MPCSLSASCRAIATEFWSIANWACEIATPSFLTSSGSGASCSAVVTLVGIAGYGPVPMPKFVRSACRNAGGPGTATILVDTFDAALLSNA